MISKTETSALIVMAVHWSCGCWSHSISYCDAQLHSMYFNCSELWANRFDIYLEKLVKTMQLDRECVYPTLPFRCGVQLRVLWSSSISTYGSYLQYKVDSTVYWSFHVHACSWIRAAGIMYCLQNWSYCCRLKWSVLSVETSCQWLLYILFIYFDCVAFNLIFLFYFILFIFIFASHRGILCIVVDS